MNHTDYSVPPGGVRNQRQPAPNMFPLFILAVMGFLLYSQYAAPPGENRGFPEQSSVEEVDVSIPGISVDGEKDGGFSDQPMSYPKSWPKTQSDWSIDTDIATTPNDAPNQTQNGDWVLDIEDSRPKAPPTASPKATQRGDWEISEVEK